MKQSLALAMFFGLSLVASLLMLFSPSLFWVWVAIELSTFLAIPFLSGEVQGKKDWHTGVAIYFVVQFMGSLTVLYASVMVWLYGELASFSYVLLFGFALKLGLFPLHFWVARSFSKFHYGGIFIVGAAHKVFAICVLPNDFGGAACNNVLYYSALMSIIYGPVAMFNAVGVKPFLAYSSVGNTGFMVLCKCHALQYMVTYAGVYCVSMFFLCLFMSGGNCDSIKNLGSDVPPAYKLGFFFLCLSFSGFPPLVDFCVKFTVLQSSLEIISVYAIIAVVVSSLVNLFVWVWVGSYAASGVPGQPGSASGPQSAMNMLCVFWNGFGGMYILALL